MSCFRRWGLPALLLSLPVLALSAGGVRADDNPPLDAKAVDALVFKTMREVINEGADMYNAKGKYENQERDYLGCYHFYEGALISTRPLLARHPDLQKLIDDGLDDAAKTPRAEMRAFVLRAVIDKIRDGVKGETTAVAPPPPKETTTAGKVVDVNKNKITVSADGKDHVLTVPPEAKVVVDGKDGRIEDVKKDGTATVTLKGDVVTKVDVKNPLPPPPPPLKETTVTGKATKVEKGKLTVKDDAGKEKNFTITESAKLTIDGKEGKLEDVKNDSTVTITSKGEEVTKVDVKAPAAPPPPPVKETTSAGKVTKVEKEKLTLKDNEGKERSFSVPETAKLTIDGKEGKLSDVKNDSTATVTSKGEEVTKVEVKGPTAPPPPPPPLTLWDRLGGEANVAKVVDDFVNAAGKDPKVNFFRDPTVTPTKEELASLKKKLVEFVSSATGGPLNYDGKSMKEAHKGMKITDAEFDAAAADLKAALEKNGAKADDVKAVLAAVEGTRKDIVEAKKPEDKDKPAPTDKDKPAPDKDKPAPTDKDKPKPADKDKPALDKDKPVIDKDKPASDKDKPIPDKDKPVIDKDKPTPDKDKPAETGKVSGKVSYKGKPVTGGVVALTDADGKTVKADLAADGTYKVEAVKAGKYKVTLNTEGLNDPTKPNPAYVPVPAVYRDAKTTPLVVEVRKGDQTLDLNLAD